ncbi:MAG: hypothetical protein JXB29_08785 [Sedimentisphaerales bacterium]|nr:hypothetical protein [Sedimentisphaerales bacterium]
MIQEYIDKNRDTIAILAKRMMIAGWILLITVPVILPFSVIQLSWASNIWSSLSFVVLRIISPVFLGLLLLVLGQFLRYELGLEAGWFLRNGVIILRVYAAVIIGFLIPQLAGTIGAIPQMSKQPLSLAGPYLYWIVLGVVKVLLLWEAASMLKMMMSGTRENTRLNV